MSIIIEEISLENDLDYKIEKEYYNNGKIEIERY